MPPAGGFRAFCRAGGLLFCYNIEKRAGGRTVIALRLADLSDFYTIVDWAKDHDADFLAQWAGRGFAHPLKLSQLMAQYPKGINSPEAGAFIYMIYKDSLQGECIGTVQFLGMDAAAKTSYLGRFLIKDENLRGRGYGKQALREMLRIGFEEFGLEVIKLNVFDFNLRAIRCYEDVGFVRGKVTENVRIGAKGDVWNNIEMSIAKSDWLKRLNRSANFGSPTR